MKIKGKHVVVGALLVFSVGLVYDSISNYINPYLTVTQISGNLNQYIGKNVQVMGIVSTGSVIRGENNIIKFSISDGQESLQVKFTGATPQNFDQEKDVVVLGSITENGVINASQILVKCPSKYEGENPPRQNYHVFLTTIIIAVIAVAYLGFTFLWKRS